MFSTFIESLNTLGLVKKEIFLKFFFVRDLLNLTFGSYSWLSILLQSNAEILLLPTFLELFLIPIYVMLSSVISYKALIEVLLTLLYISINY